MGRALAFHTADLGWISGISDGPFSLPAGILKQLWVCLSPPPQKRIKGIKNVFPEERAKVARVLGSDLGTAWYPQHWPTLRHRIGSIFRARPGEPQSESEGKWDFLPLKSNTAKATHSMRIKATVTDPSHTQTSGGAPVLQLELGAGK